MKWSQVFFLMWPLWSICYWCSSDKPIAALVLAALFLFGSGFMFINEQAKKDYEGLVRK